jgi:tetratricopeptide (TPR) repeat protein
MELTVKEALQRAIAAQEEGDFQSARRLYLIILKAYPSHPDASHNLGALEMAEGKYEAALSLLKNALEANPSVDQFWLSYIDCLIKASSVDAAKQTLDEAAKAGVSQNNLSPLVFALQSIGQEIETLATRAPAAPEKSKKHPKNKQNSKQDHGVTSPPRQQLEDLQRYYQSGQLEEFEQLAVSITEEFPDDHIGWKALGVAHHKSGRLSESVSAMRQAIKLAPRDAQAHNNLGNTLKNLARFDEALAS